MRSGNERIAGWLFHIDDRYDLIHSLELDLSLDKRRLKDQDTILYVVS